MTHDVRIARSRLSRLIDLAHAGEDVVISRGGKPVARLSPIWSPVPFRLGILAGKVDPNSAPDFLERSSEDEQVDDQDAPLDWRRRLW